MKVVLLLALCVCLSAASPSNRIVGGSETSISQYRYMTALLYAGNQVNFRQACGGSLINNRNILTAAHCTYGTYAQQWRLRLGSTYASSGGTVYNVEKYINHPNYNNRNLDNDYCLMKTTSNIAYNNNVQPITIAGGSYNLADNAVVWAAGWGLTRDGGSPSETLRHVQIWTVNQAVCRQRYGSSSITDNMLCAGWLDVGGRDQCQQDSGGPLVHNGVLVGITSWGGPCADAWRPGVNARVSRGSSWITSTANSW